MTDAEPSGSSGEPKTRERMKSMRKSAMGERNETRRKGGRGRESWDEPSIGDESSHFGEASSVESGGGGELEVTRRDGGERRSARVDASRRNREGEL